MAFKPGERLQVARMSSEEFGWNLAAPIMFPCTNEYKMLWSVAVDAELLLVVAYNITQQLGSCNATWSIWFANGWTDTYLVWNQRSLCTNSKCRLHIRLSNRQNWISQDNRHHETIGFGPDAVNIDLLSQTGNAESKRKKKSGMLLHRALVKMKSLIDTNFRTVWLKIQVG